MSKVIGRGQRLIPEYLLKYLENQKANGMNITQLVDSKGNPRFIEGEGVPGTIAGFTPSYHKWSLSGTHLMLVLSGTFENGSVIDATGSQITLVEFSLPKFIFDKIIPVFASAQIDRKSISAYADNWTTQTFSVNLSKDGTKIKIFYPQGGSTTFSATRSFRIQFDLLIDSD